MKLLESLCVMDGKVQNLPYHQKRIDFSVKDLFKDEGSDSSSILLESVLEIPEQFSQGLYKCRILYSQKIHSITFESYKYPLIKNMKIVINDVISYRYKFEDRSELRKLYDSRGEADDILIVKNGYITDSYFANVCFFNQEEGWITPKTPLLAGTMRAHLLNEKIISESIIKPEMLLRYEKLSLINALLPLGKIELPIEAVQGI